MVVTVLQEDALAVNLACINPSKLLEGVNNEIWYYPWVSKAHKSWYGVYMRSRCSETWPHNENSRRVRDKCEKANVSVSVSNVLSVTPVSTPDITYRNVYCAICNYHNASEYAFWKPGVYCAYRSYTAYYLVCTGSPSGTDSSYNVDPASCTVTENENCSVCRVSMDDPRNGNMTLQITEKYCSIAYFEWPNVTARWLDPLRPCIAETFVDKCLPYYQLQNMSGDEYNYAARQCCSYADFLYISDEELFFKNAHCALCNGADLASLKCVDLWRPRGQQSYDDGLPLPPWPGTSFTALLDFSDRGQISLEDATTKQVLTESCAEGQVYNPERMHCMDLSCPTNFELAGDVCKPSTPERILLNISIILFTNATTEQVKEITSDSNIDALQNELLAALQPHVVNGTVQQLNISPSNIPGTLYIHLVMNIVNNIYTIARIRAELKNISLQFYHDDILLQSSAITVQIQTQTPVNELNCTVYIALNESEYQLFDNKSIFVTATNTLLHQSDYTISNDIILRCNEFNQTFNRTVTVRKTWTYNTVFIILSVAGSGILLLACISLLTTYTLFKELRTLPGKCIMSYAAAVAMSQIFFLFGPGLTSNHTVCTAMGFCLHFFILSQFTWSSVLATGLCRTFVLMQRVLSSQRDSQSRTFLIYNSYAWGVPFITCLIAVILDQHSNVNIDYASDRICWLQPGMALLVAFGVPVAVILVYNLLAFIALSVSIYRASKTESMARSEMIEKQKTLSRIRHQFKIFLGVFSLLSLSWIPAFLGAINELEWLWYMFMVATILQGILLFVVFVLNRKVRQLYANVYKKKSEQQTSNAAHLRTQQTSV